MPTIPVMGFDLEQYIPDSGEGHEVSLTHPISCAVTTLSEPLTDTLLVSQDAIPATWFTASGSAGLLFGDTLESARTLAGVVKPDPTMDFWALSFLVDEMLEARELWIPVVTWHGAAFDMPSLAHHTGRWDDMRMLTMDSIDLHLLFQAVRRHRLGLRAAAAAVGSSKGGSGIESGLEAMATWPDRWLDILAYCAQDVQATLDVYAHLVKHGGFHWMSKAGKPQKFVLPSDLRDPATWTVRHLLTEYAWPEPERWITEPATPDAPVYAWLREGRSEPSPVLVAELPVATLTASGVV